MVPKFASNATPLLSLNWPSMCVRDLRSKLSFLHRLSLGSQVFKSFTASDVMSMSLGKQCKLLESLLGTNFTDGVLTQTSSSMRNLKERILKADRIKLLKSPNATPLYREF